MNGNCGDFSHCWSPHCRVGACPLNHGAGASLLFQESHCRWKELSAQSRYEPSLTWENPSRQSKKQFCVSPCRSVRRWQSRWAPSAAGWWSGASKAAVTWHIGVARECHSRQSSDRPLHQRDSTCQIALETPVFGQLCHQNCHQNGLHRASRKISVATTGEKNDK